MSLKPEKEDAFLPNNYVNFSNIVYGRARANNASIPGLDKLENGSDRMRFVQHIKSSGDDYAKMLGLPVIYTSDVHDVTFGRQPYGDFFFSDMLAGLFDFSGNKTILDFGCSTGRVIRNLKSAYPDIDAYGCDPRAASIEFIRPLVPDVNWFVSNEAPPLAHKNLPKFDLIFAISVWSHFSEKRGLEWFNEMASQINKGGKLIFTTHGFRSAHHFSEVKKSMPLEKARERIETLRKGNLHFKRYPKNDLDAHWGMAFLPPSWVEKKLRKFWEIDGYYPGLAMANQDTYVLVKK